MARRKLDQYFRAGTAWLVRETGKPVVPAGGDLRVNGHTSHEGVAADVEETLIFGAVLPASLSAPSAPAGGDPGVNGSTLHSGAAADGEETIIFRAALPPSLAPVQTVERVEQGPETDGEETGNPVTLADGDLGVNGSTLHGGAAADGEETIIFRAALPPSLAPVQLAERVEPAPAVATTAQARPRSSWFTLAPLGLFCILTIQAVLSLRLVWSNTAFLDEGTYLFIGHVELAHWLTGAAVPTYPAWLSGAPVIYPPLGALANHLGGLVGARILSMCFMLGATSLLWGMTSRLADRRSALFAAAIFAALGPTQALGALATFDAMALFLVAAAAWCIVAARDHPDSSLLVMAGAVLLALANATKYMTVLFDPVVVGLAALTVWPKRGLKPGLGRGGFIAVCSIGVLAGLLGLGGSLYVHAILYSTLIRANGGNSPLLVLTDSAKLIGLCCFLAAGAVAVAALAGKDRFELAIFAVLAFAALLVPLNQARINTTTSLFKHVDYGAWFAAAAAGYAVARLSHIVRWKPIQVIAATIALGAVVIPLGSMGRAEARDFFHAWPNSSAVTKILRSVTRSYPGNYLAEDTYVPAYYLQDSVSWQRWSDTWYFSYLPPGKTVPITGLAAYRSAIENHYFSLIILDFGDTASTDKYLVQYIHKAKYNVVAEAPYWSRFGTGRFTIWAYQRPSPLPGRHRGEH